MQDRTVIITGANSGIGKATAIELAKMGATVVMVSRNQEKGKHAQAEIQEKTGNKNVELLLADLSSMQEVRRLTEEIQVKYPKLNVLINNAGLFNQRRYVTADGYESTFGINYLAPFLLTNLLLDQLKSNAPSRIVNVSSVAHYSGHINFSDLNLEQGYSSWKAYQNSKLALVLFTYELARRLEGTKVTANTVHPGAVATNIRSRPLGPAGFIMLLPKAFMKNAKKGAETVVYLASSPEAEKVTGEYWDSLKVKKSSDESYNQDVAKRLWMVSEQLTRLKPLELAQ